MARTKISEFSATAADNTDIDNIDIAEGCAPSGINNAIRELMAQLKDFQTGAAGDPFNGAVNGTVGATTPAAGAFTTLSASSTVSGTGFSNYFASPPAIGGTTAAAGTFTNLAYTGTLTGGTGVINIGSGQVYKDASGNVGIGTSSPAFKLHINGASSQFACISTTDTTSTTGILFGDSASNTVGRVEYVHSSDLMQFYTAGTVKSVIDASGNLGLGVTPSAWSALKSIDISTWASFAGFTNQTSVLGNAFYNGSNYIYKTTAVATMYEQNSAGAHAWFTAPSGTAGNTISFTQAMTLTAASQLLVGTTTVDSVGVTIAAADNNGCYSGSASTATRNHWRFANPNGVVGTIQTSGSATSYNTSSDYRLKENIEPMTGALATVAALKPCTYTWKADGSAGQGFIAHELQAVVPDCVTGEKDAVDAEGKPQYQGVDVSFLVATLTAAIQEQQAIITQLQADVAALKGAA